MTIRNSLLGTATVVLYALAPAFAGSGVSSGEIARADAALRELARVERSPLSSPTTCDVTDAAGKPSLADRIARGMKISVKTSVAYDSKAEQFLNGSAQLRLLVGNKEFDAAVEEIGARTYQGPRYIVNAEVAYSPAGDAALEPTRTDSIAELNAGIDSNRQRIEAMIAGQVDSALAQDPRLQFMPAEARAQLRAELIASATAEANRAIEEERASQIARIKGRTARLAKNNRIPEGAVTVAYVLGNGAGMIYSKAGISTHDGGPSRSFGESRLDEKLPFKSPVQQAGASDPSRLVKVGTELRLPARAAMTVEATAFHDRPATDGARVMNSVGLAVSDAQFKELYESEKLDSLKGTLRLKKAGVGEFYVSGGARGKNRDHEVGAGGTLELTRSTTLLADAYQGSGAFLDKGLSVYLSQKLPLKLEAVAGATYVKGSFRSDMAADRNNDNHHISYRKYTGGLNLNLLGDRSEKFFWDLRVKAHGYHLDPISNVAPRAKGNGIHAGAFIEGAWGMPRKAAKAAERPVR